jgi:putative addiction module CopG family antidote
MKLSLPRQLEEFISEQVRIGGFKTGEEVVREAVRRMQEAEHRRETEAFRTAFRQIDQHSPVGEPTEEDLAQIDRIIRSIRFARRQCQAA